jgi:hypothetical protein
LKSSEAKSGQESDSFLFFLGDKITLSFMYDYIYNSMDSMLFHKFASTLASGLLTRIDFSTLEIREELHSYGIH